MQLFKKRSEPTVPSILDDQLLAMLEGMSGRIMAVDTNLTITYANPAVITYLSSLEEAIRKDLPNFNSRTLIGTNIDIFHKNPIHQRTMLGAMETPYDTSISISGQVFNLRAYPLISKSGKHIGSAVEWLDPIHTDNAGQVDAISKSQAVIHFDLNGVIIDCNQLFLDTMGYSKNEVIGRHHSMFARPEIKNSSEYSAFWQSLKDGRFQEGKFERVSKSGEPVWLQATYNPIYDMKGKPYKVVKYATSITKQVKLIETVQLLTSDMREAVDNAKARSIEVENSSSSTLSNVQAVAAGAEEMDSSVNEIAQSMSKSRAAVVQAGEKSNYATQATKELSITANNMTGIVELIQDIAAQINLLSLNATIEAARAGEAGKGFGVVASEVKNLAMQAATATAKINEEIEKIQRVSSEVSHAVKQMEESFSTIEDYVSTTAAAVEEQSAVSREMATNMNRAAASVQEINDGIRKINCELDDLKKGAEDTEKAALYMS